MQITITLESLVFWLMILSTLVVNGWLFRLKWMQKKEKERVQKGFATANPLMRWNKRFQTLFAEGIHNHAHVAADDLRCMISIMKHKEGVDQPFFLNEGSHTISDWTTGNGREMIEMIRDGFENVERARPGFIRVLQVLLDEARDRVNHASTKH